MKPLFLTGNSKSKTHGDLKKKKKNISTLFTANIWKLVIQLDMLKLMILTLTTFTKKCKITSIN